MSLWSDVWNTKKRENRYIFDRYNLLRVSALGLLYTNVCMEKFFNLQKWSVTPSISEQDFCDFLRSRFCFYWRPFLLNTTILYLFDFIMSSLCRRVKEIVGFLVFYLLGPNTTSFQDRHSVTVSWRRLPTSNIPAWKIPGLEEFPADYGHEFVKEPDTTEQLSTHTLGAWDLTSLTRD